MDNDLILKTAKKRVGFKKHVTIYILANLLLWVLFFFYNLFKEKGSPMFFHFIIFVLITWTILIIGHYFYAMKWNEKMLDKEIDNITKETEKLDD